MQLYFGLLVNANIKGFLSGRIYSYAAGTKFLCSPGLNCYSCPGASTACPIGALQNSFYAGKSTFVYIFGILLLYGVILGRSICGWLCPFGLIQDLLHQIPTPKIKKSPVTRALRWVKYLILIVFGLIVPLAYAFRGAPLPAFCKYICPAGTLEGGMLLLSHKVNSSMLSSLGPLFSWKFLLMVSIIVSCVFIYRVFCRFLCPLGVIYGLFNRISLLGVQVVEDKCIHCELCVSHCKMDIRHVSDSECIQCGECIPICPTKAIQWRGEKAFQRVCPPSGKKKTGVRIVIAVLMLAILGGAIAYCWSTTPPLGSASQGYAPGQQLPGMELPLITADGIEEETVDPTKMGKITVINFWGTWCGGCLEELPYFDQIASEYADTVQVIAIHTDALHNTAPAYIAQHFPESQIIFAKDVASSGLDVYYGQLGGLGGYPYTVVIDDSCIVLTNISSTLSYEQLRQIIQNALKN